jgi:GntR family transcriptional regulator
MPGSKQQRMAGERPLLSVSVRGELARRIEQGELPEGTRLPAEPELAAHLGVSRATLREALQALEADGFLRRQRGAGTFVLDPPKVANSLDLNFGVTDAIRAAGMRPGTREAAYRVEPATVGDAERLGVAPGRNLLVVERVRTADERPVVVTSDILVHDLFEGREEVVEKLLDGSVYEILREQLGLVVEYGIAGFRPTAADSVIAERLRVERGELLVYLWQVDYTSEDAPVLLSHEYHLADAFEFSFMRRGPGRRTS